MSLTKQLIQLIKEKPVTDADLDSAALFTLDAVAAAYAGRATPVGKTLRGWSKATPLDLKRKAFLMGALTHITETDDLHRASVTHPGCVVVPTALALGESIGASAQKILRSILHGYEAMCRIGASVGPTHYKVWHNTATCGPFGSAMAAATLLDLDEEQTLHALGNAGTQSSGFWQFMESGAMSKHLHAGRAAESGWLAAEMAQFGFTGSPEILEGEKGLYAGMCIDPIPGAVLADADSPWQLPLTSIKPWPSCRHTHPAIDCALELHGLLDGESIAEVTVDTYQAALDVCDRLNPENEYQAKFSLYHTVSIALLDGKVDLSSFTKSARSQTELLRSNTLVNVADPFASAYPQSWGSGVTVKTKGGEPLRTQRKDCKGDPELALNDQEMHDKAANLIQYDGVSEEESMTICDQILQMPKSASLSTVFSQFILKIL